MRKIKTKNIDIWENKYAKYVYILKTNMIYQQMYTEKGFIQQEVEHKAKIYIKRDDKHRKGIYMV